MSIPNNERKLKLLEDMKLMEEDDLALVYDLFSEQKYNCHNKEKSITLQFPVKFINRVIKKDKTQDVKILQEKQKSKKEKDKKEKDKKIQAKRHNEIYGDLEEYEYDDIIFKKI